MSLSRGTRSGAVRSGLLALAMTGALGLSACAGLTRTSSARSAPSTASQDRPTARRAASFDGPPAASGAPKAVAST